ncbi:MAG: ABC transporter ATP-binding protein [Planctomycetota bacterium]|jgi:putative ABC transport system ATP-binding protein
MSEPIIRLRKVTRRFEEGRIVALDSVDLEVQRSEFVAIMGPSGSGKTTLLNLIGAMDLPDDGEVVVDGIRLRDKKTMEQVRATRIGFVFQRHNLIPVLSAAENVEIPLVPRDGPRRERRARAVEILRLVGLGERADSNVRVLSGGERQRVAVARAMIHEPPLILADEPTGDLDSHTGIEVMNVIHELRSRTGAALVLVTHDETVTLGCDRRLRMLDGRLAEV